MKPDGLVNKFYSLASPCKLCPNNCNAKRLHGEMGVCKTGINPMISSANLHFGEEKVLTGSRGSGTIFFTGCNLKCVYCQNYDISHEMRGKVISLHELVEIMLDLQKKGAENINLVTPTHQTHVIVDALFRAKDKGLKIPVVYNCGGYEKVSTLKLLEGIIDIYMPDAKYFDNAHADKFSGADDYADILKEALVEMHRQVGDLKVNQRGVAVKGLLIRHLVLPGGLNGISGSKKILDFIKNDISKNSYVNVMAQYHPCFKAYNYPQTVGKRLLYSHYTEVKEYAEKIGLTRGLE